MASKTRHTQAHADCVTHYGGERHEHAPPSLEILGAYQPQQTTHPPEERQQEVSNGQYKQRMNLGVAHSLATNGRVDYR